MLACDERTSIDGETFRVEITKAVYAKDSSAGGDRAEAFQGPDGNVHLIILDACGHGTEAVHLADIALHTARTLLWQGLTPAMVFASINRLLLDLYQDRDTFFGTGAIASLHPQSTLVTFSSAGHVDAFSFDGSGRKHTHHPSTGPLYGVVADARYENERFHCRPGEALVMLTDGLSDVAPIDRPSGYLGTAGICDVVRELLGSRGGLSAQHLISRVRRIAGGGFHDDVAAMIATMFTERGRVATLAS